MDGHWPWGQGAEGLAQVCLGIATMQATGAALFVPYMCTLLADVAAHLGHPADGLQALTEAHTLVERREERWWEAEVARLRGVVLLRQPEPAWAEAGRLVAARPGDRPTPGGEIVRAARRHKPRPPVATAGRPEEARELLAPIYGWFTEVLIQRTSRKPRRCWRSWRDNTGVITRW